MPLSPNFAIPYENPLTSGDQPGVTLHGGSPPQGPGISALRIDEVLTDLQAQIVALTAQVATASVLVASLDVAGLGISDATLTLPASGYSHYTVLWHGNHNAAGGAGIASLMVRFNGDSGNNYGRSGAHTDTAGPGSSWAFNAEQTGVNSLRAGYVGSGLRSAGSFRILGAAGGFSTPTVEGTSMFNGTTNGRALGIGAGTWSGTTPITSITVWPLSNLWSNGTVSVYGNP